MLRYFRMRPCGMGVLFVCFLLAHTTHAQPPAEPIHAGDLLYIEIYRVPELTTTYQVDDSGNVNLAYVGPVQVAGLTETDASATVAAALGTILRNPRVSVSKSGVNLQQPLLGRTPDMRLELVPLHNADAATISQALHGMTSPGGNIGFDPDTNTLIITDTPTAVQNIMHAVARLDQMQSQLTQVRIEAKIAEVRVGAMKELGIRWFVQGTEGAVGFYPPPPQDTSILTRRGPFSPFDNERIGDNDPFGGNENNNLGRRFVDPFTRRLNVPVQVPLPGQSFLGFFNEHLDIGMLLDALVTDKDADLLANPMTLTVNHKTAFIKMTDEFPYTEFGTEITGATNFSTRFM
ncbi:MAG: polysaccharide biosynthesis/export family protein, partial [Candidatus Hydrogenedentales bacterium]